MDRERMEKPDRHLGLSKAIRSTWATSYRNESGGDFLWGWKQIREYMGLPLYTVKRMHRDWGLPVIRLPTMTKGVFTTKPNLVDWVRRLDLEQRRVHREIQRIDGDSVMRAAGTRAQTRKAKILVTKRRQYWTAGEVIKKKVRRLEPVGLTKKEVEQQERREASKAGKANRGA